MSKVGQAVLGIIVMVGMTAAFYRAGVTILDRPEVFFAYHGQEDPTAEDVVAIRVEGKWIPNPQAWLEKNTRRYEPVWVSPEWKPPIPVEENFPVVTAIAR